LRYLRIAQTLCATFLARSFLACGAKGVLREYADGGDTDLHDTDFNVALVAIHIPVNAATGPSSPDETSRQ
jgi:hypothetical protein